MMNTYTLKVISIKKETEDTITICFKQPALRKIKYKSGQYLTLIFRINGRRYIRPYSFSSAPLFDSELEITVKRIPNGIVSNHIHDIVQVGDSIEVMSPMGDFVYNSSGTNDLVFLWGAGSGITPLISIAKHILLEFTSAKINLIYGNRSNETTIFGNLIDKLLQDYPERFKVWHFITQLSVNQDLPYIIQGRINKANILQIMNDVPLSESLHYICGPYGLKESVKESLSLLNVSSTQIFSEDFELLKDPKSYEDIHTRSIKLKFIGQEYELEVIKGKSVLESALDAGIELPYSCQTGNCSTCKATIQSGELKMIGLENLRQDLLFNEYLLCCSHPLTNDVYIEV